VIRFYVQGNFSPPTPLRVLGVYFSGTISLQDGGNEGDLFVPAKIGHQDDGRNKTTKNRFRSTARVAHFTLVCFIVVMYGSPTSRPSVVLYVRIR
jgi:hypothetical protein